MYLEFLLMMHTFCFVTVTLGENRILWGRTIYDIKKKSHHSEVLIRKYKSMLMEKTYLSSVSKTIFIHLLNTNFKEVNI